jgi:hypothetical protein
VQEGALAEVETVEGETLAPALEAVTRLALEKMTQILKIPTDRDGNLLRAQTAAAGIAVNAQLRADETRLKQVRSRDIMERIRAMLAEEEAKMAELEAQMAEDERRKREGEGPAAARTDIVGSSTCVEDAGISVKNANDRA